MHSAKGRTGSVPGVQISVVGFKCVPLSDALLGFSDLPSIPNVGHHSLTFHSACLWAFGTRSAGAQRSCTGFKESPEFRLPVLHRGKLRPAVTVTNSAQAASRFNRVVKQIGFGLCLPGNRAVCHLGKVP